MDEGPSHNHQGRAHARLSGSVASIFMACTAAPDLWQGRERKATSYTREGTAAHEMADAHLGSGVLPPPPGSLVTVEGESVEITPDMREAVRLYVDLVHALRAQAQWHVVEQSFALDALWTDVGETPPEPLFGTADFAGVIARTLVLVDLKFGKGVQVRAENNAQLLYYALGAYLFLRERFPEIARALTHVRMMIMQPRVSEQPSLWEIPLLDLLLWGHTLKATVDQIQTGNTTLVAGAHCTFCTARGACPALHAQAMSAAKDTFPPLAPMLLNDAEIGYALDQADLLITWLNGVRQEAETRIKNGGQVPGWKLVVKKGNRRWVSESKAQVALDQIAHHGTFLTEPVLVSPAQAEKKLKIMGVDPGVIAPLVHAPETGTTLVPAGDPRPAVATGPRAVFTPVIEPPSLSGPSGDQDHG